MKTIMCTSPLSHTYRHFRGSANRTNAIANRVYRNFSRQFHQPRTMMIFCPRQRSRAGPAGRGRRLAAVPERAQRLRAVVLPGQGGRPGARRRRPQDLPVGLHQGLRSAPVSQADARPGCHRAGGRRGTSCSGRWPPHPRRAHYQK